MLSEDIKKETITEPRPVLKDYSREALKRYLSETFAIYGIADQIPMAEATILCESGWNWKADNGISYGIAQFTPATWYDFGHGDIFDPYVQIQTMAKMWSRGLQKRWDCWRMLN